MRYKNTQQEQEESENNAPNKEVSSCFWTLFNTDGTIVYQEDEDIKQCI